MLMRLSQASHEQALHPGNGHAKHATLRSIPRKSSREFHDGPEACTHVRRYPYFATLLATTMSAVVLGVVTFVSLAILALFAIPSATPPLGLASDAKSSSRWSLGPELSGHPVRRLGRFAMYRDPCFQALPLQRSHRAFDNGLFQSDEFSVDHASHGVDAPLAERVFATYFADFLFEPEHDLVVNLSSAGQGRGHDARMNRLIAERTLRSFYNSSIVSLRAVTMTYAHVDRVRGVRFVVRTNSTVSAARTDDSSAANTGAVTHRTHSVIIQRTFDGICRVGVVPVHPDKWARPVYVVVPYYKRAKRMAWFLNQFKQLVSLSRVPIKLVVSAFGIDEQDFRTQFRLTDPTKDQAIMVVSSGRTGHPGFSRAVAIRDAARLVPYQHIMFIADIDMEIHAMFFESCLANTIRASQVYFPVFYNLYAGEKSIGKDKGYWRTTSYGMSCMYRSDFDEVRAYHDAEHRYAGWGREDMDLMLLFMNRPRQYQVFRAVEPALRHRWHVKHCGRDSMVYEDCLQVAYSSLGSASRLGQALLATGNNVQALFARYDEDESRLAKDYDYYSEFAKVVDG